VRAVKTRRMTVESTNELVRDHLSDLLKCRRFQSVVARHDSSGPVSQHVQVTKDELAYDRSGKGDVS
jgi:predicted component of type VI protein secretion system